MGETHPTPASNYNKARPSDYFTSSKRTPNSKRSHDYFSTGSSKAQLSRTNDDDTTIWDKDGDVGYSQEIKASGGGVAEGRFVAENEDLELGQLGQRRLERGRLYGGCGGADVMTVNEERKKDGIMKTVEYDVR